MKILQKGQKSARFLKKRALLVEKDTLL